MMSDALARNGVFRRVLGQRPAGHAIHAAAGRNRRRYRRNHSGRPLGRGHDESLLPLALPAARIPFVLRMLNSERVQTVLFNWLRSLEDLAKVLTEKRRKAK
jgi:hypothetical protein